MRIGQAEGFLHALFGMMRLNLSAPDSTTLPRRSRHLRRCASRIPNSLGRIRPTCVASAQCGPRRVVARHGATAPGRTVAACVQRALLDSHPVSAKRPEDGG